MPAGSVWVASGLLAGPVALGVVSASAFMSPVGSVSSLLLLQVARGAPARVLVRVFLLSAVVALLALPLLVMWSG